MRRRPILDEVFAEFESTEVPARRVLALAGVAIDATAHDLRVREQEIECRQTMKKTAGKLRQEDAVKRNDKPAARIKVNSFCKPAIAKRVEAEENAQTGPISE
jgi:hypothetical protein